MQEEKFSPEQSLQVIHSMIEKARNQFSENGHLYLLWGWVVLFCSLAQFVLLKFIHYERHYLVWMACWLAVIYQVFYLRNQRRKQKVRTYADRLVGFVWITFFILLMLIGFLIMSTGNEENGKLIGPSFLALYGMPTFLSGILLRFPPLVLGGIACWLLSVLAWFIGYDYQLLLLSSAMIVAWIIPGYILRKNYKQQKT